MATFQKFDCFVQDLGSKVHALGSDSLFVALTNVSPVTTNTVLANISDLATGGGYTAGGVQVPGTTFSQAAGVATLVGDDVIFSASTGFGPFRYAVLYNAAALGKNLIGWWDYGTSISLTAGQAFTVEFGDAILTLS